MPRRCPLLAALTLVGALLFIPAAVAGDAPKLRVAVMAFESASADPAHESLGKGLQAMITTDLHEVGQFDLVERARLADIQAELDLAKTGAIDKATASRIGKLAGASHLLAGTVTVVGPKMRIDARLFATESGDILLAESIEGATDEFFDLEKALVGKLVSATGVTMEPRVRVRVQRVHTADFKAFRTYSEGIDAFDKEDYQRSVELLAQAASIDPDFTLATLTMEQYEREIAAMKTRAIDVAVDERRAAELKRNEGAQKEVAELEPFWELARKTGKGHAVERLWGLYNLYRHYDDSYSRLRNLHGIEDRFELERIADALAGQYVAEAQALFPRVPLTPEYKHGWRWDREPTTDRDKKKHDGEVTSARRNWARLCMRLHLDDKRCGDLLMRVAERLTKAGGDPEDIARVLQTAGERYRHAADPDASTVAFSAAQKLSTDTYNVSQLVKEVEANRNVKALLAACKGPWVREALALSGWSKSFRETTCEAYESGDLREPLSLDGARTLTSQRNIPKRGPILVSGHPVWVFGSRDVTTGPRSTATSTDQLTYYVKEEVDHGGSLAIIDGQKRAALDLRLEVSYQPHASWYPMSAYRPRDGQTKVEYTAARPKVVIAFGLVDVDVRQSDDPDTGQRRISRPMRGYGVQLDAGRVHLVEVNEQPGPRAIFRTNHFADLSLAWKRVDLKSLQTQRASNTARDTFPVRVLVKGKKVTVSVAGQTTTLDLPRELAEAPSGYYGVWFDGVGYAHVGDLAVK